MCWNSKSPEWTSPSGFPNSSTSGRCGRRSCRGGSNTALLSWTGNRFDGVVKGASVGGENCGSRSKLPKPWPGPGSAAAGCCCCGAITLLLMAWMKASRGSGVAGAFGGSGRMSGGKESCWLCVVLTARSISRADFACIVPDCQFILFSLNSAHSIQLSREYY